MQTAQKWGAVIERAPFPWYGGKSRAAKLVWERFGNVPNYVEPFFGSGAVLLNRPTAARIETVNDKDCFVSNFWRALQQAPAQVARWADWPVSEADLHARHRWLVQQSAFIERMKTDPHFFDVKIAGWWVNAISEWIGGEFCSQTWQTRPHLGKGGNGVHSNDPSRQLPAISGDSGATGRGVHASGRQESLLLWFERLATRLRTVRVCSGDWTRILGPSPTTKVGITGVFFDPPYASTSGRDMGLYGVDDANVAHDVREWAISHGDDPKLRIALCGYEGEHVMPGSWECVHWKAGGGYGAQRRDGSNQNAKRERIWFSPHCLDVGLPFERTA